MFMLVVASNMRDTMVTDDYSKEGRGINLEIARDQAAADMGLNADMAFEDRSILLNVNTQERSEEHTSELQSRPHLVCRLLLEKKNILLSTNYYAISRGC